MHNARVALVTAGMTPLGSAICHRLEQAGFRVAITTTPDDAVRLGAGEEALAPIFAYETELADPPACERMMRHLLAEVGRIDVLVNTVSVARDVSLRRMSAQDWRAVLRTNLDSMFNLCKLVAEPMVAQRWGRIINISSVNSQRGAFGQTHFAAAKAATHGFGKALALELARHGVTVNTVAPGYLRGMRLAPELVSAQILPQIPVGRLGKPEEVAALVAYLASEQAGFVTGAEIAINGGQHMM